MDKQNVTKPFKGLHTDNSLQDQPKDTYAFALNATMESQEGDLGFLGNEESTENCVAFPEDYIPIGKRYMANGQVSVILVKNDESACQIGILTTNCTYTVFVDDTTNELGLKISNQCDITYRLRRGCERTIYWVDGDNNKPRIFNYDKLDSFKDNLGNWDISKFNLFKIYNTIPNYDKIEINNNGAIPPGSYNGLIQYLDENLNPTEFMSPSDTIIIYNDNTKAESFSSVRGSTNKVSDYQDFGVTNKAIKFTLNNLDDSFPFYRFAIVEANNGSGRVSKVVYSEVISTETKYYTYTGTNAATIGTEEEVQKFQNVIESADSIDQIENRLVLGRVKGKSLKYCKLQKYASKIGSNLVLESVVLNSANVPNNPKRGEIHFEKLGYMPGEVYSFGIVYVFKDKTVSPTYHIPGKAFGYTSQMRYDNFLTGSNYVDNSSCEDYWGVDIQGNSLVGEHIRHHRFPLRSEVNEPLFSKFSDYISVITTNLFIDISGNLAVGYPDNTLDYVVNYTVNGNPFQKYFTLDLTTYDPLVGVNNIFVINSVDVIVFTSVQEIVLGVPVDPSTNSELIYTSRIEINVNSVDEAVYRSNIFGIKFHNIDLPPAEEIGEEIIGYYIVRNPRTEDDKTILDNGVVLPLIIEERDGVSKFVSHGHLTPNTNKIKEDVFALIHPCHKFENKEYKNTTTYIKQGEYTVNTKSLARRTIRDIMPGTSYDSSVHTRRERDSDGFDFHTMIRNSKLDYNMAYSVFADSTEIVDTFYLDALSSNSVIDINNESKEIYNLSSDNKIGFIQLNKSISTVDSTTKFPYVVMKRDLNSFYSNFRTTPFFREHENMQVFNTTLNNETSIFNGDSYIGSMKYISTMFYDIKLKSRRTKSAVWNFIVGVISAIVGVVLAVTGVGIALAAGVLAFGVSQIAAGVKKKNIKKVYQELYEQGLRDTVEDVDTASVFGIDFPDDQIQYFTDCLNDLWVETSVNINWRMGSTAGITDFLDSPTGYNPEELLTYSIEKSTILDSGGDGGRLYQGFTKAELYEVNEDYKRRERQKMHFSLGLEYDCCSDCGEDFPQRIHSSEPAFQEELSDNYRVFLPNNYIDIEGENGKITNIFKIQNNLFIHTEEALWHLPQNIQERVTGDIISFLGTGEFFSIPPRKILDDDSGNSAGSQHKWGTLKTPLGVFFPCESQSTFYKFDGNSLVPISKEGEFNWFKNNSIINLDRDFFNANGREYLYKDNPSSVIGTGYIAAYDSRKERVIFTKKDYVLKPITVEDSPNDYQILIQNGIIILFLNYQDRIDIEVNDNWIFVGFENSQMLFQRTVEGVVQFKTLDGIEISLEDFYNNSWTKSFSLKFNSWTSYHSYLPNLYVNTPDEFYSWSYGNLNNSLLKHNKIGSYQRFNNVLYPFIVEYISLSEPLQTRVWDYIKFLSEAKRYNVDLKQFVDERFITFNKVLLYNSRQSTGELKFLVKDTYGLDEDYLSNQVIDLNADEIVLDRNERDWSFNEIRDIRVDYNAPLFNKKLEDLQTNYFIDKIINDAGIDFDKDWTELESFRDKYLVVRLIFDNFDDVKLLLNYSIENEKPSFR